MSGHTEGQQFEELTYEGFGPGGVAIIVEVLTDNRDRTNGEVRKLFERGGGNMGEPGCVGYLFERKGLFGIEGKAIDEDALMNIVQEAATHDIRRVGSNFEVVCDPSQFNPVKEALEKMNVPTVMAELTQLPKMEVDVEGETAQKVLRLVVAIDDHDDVHNVFSNANISEAMLAE